jgi:hypothetical protein
VIAAPVTGLVSEIIACGGVLRYNMFRVPEGVDAHLIIIFSMQHTRTNVHLVLLVERQACVRYIRIDLQSLQPVRMGQPIGFYTDKLDTKLVVPKKSLISVLAGDSVGGSATIVATVYGPPRRGGQIKSE